MTEAASQITAHPLSVPRRAGLGRAAGRGRAAYRPPTRPVGGRRRPRSVRRSATSRSGAFGDRRPTAGASTPTASTRRVAADRRPRSPRRATAISTWSPGPTTSSTAAARRSSPVRSKRSSARIRGGRSVAVVGRGRPRAGPGAGGLRGAARRRGPVDPRVAASAEARLQRIELALKLPRAEQAARRPARRGASCRRARPARCGGERAVRRPTSPLLTTFDCG